MNVLITGASTGFGYLTTQLLLKKGHKVIATSRDPEKLRGKILASDEVKKFASELFIYPLNLENIDHIHLISKSVDHFFNQHLDVLVNNAGFGVLGPIELQDPKLIQKQMTVNFMGPIVLIQSLLPYLRKTKGKIINVTSLVGYTVFPFYGTYAASKHALDIVTEALFYELNEFGIQVCNVEPGAYRTDFSQNAVLIDIDKDNNSQVTSFYQERWNLFLKFLDLVKEKMEKDPLEVAQTILKLCEQTTIPVRKQVGRDAIFNWYLKKWLPDQFRIRWIHRIYRRFFF